MKFLQDTYIKNISVLFSGNVFAQLIPFLLAPIITRIFSPEELGLYGNFVTLIALISIAANGRLELALVLPKKDEKALQLLKLGLKISVIVSLLSFLLLVIKTPLENFYETKLLTRYLPFISFTVFTISTHNLFVQWLVRKKQFYSITLIKILLSLSTNLIIIGLGWLKFGTEGLIYGYVISFALTTIVLFFITNKKVNWKLPAIKTDKELLKEYKEFPIINSLHSFTDILFSEFIILAIITHQFGLVATGLFVIMMKYLKAPTRFIGHAIGQVFYPEASQYHLENKPIKKLLQKSIKITLLAAIPIVVIISLWGPQLFGWYLGADWIETGIYAQIMVIPIVLGLITSPISSTPLIFKRQTLSFIINLTGMFLAALAFYLTSMLTDNIYYSLLSLAGIQTVLYVILLIWFFKLSKV